jgi:predicted transcriptional regulator
MLSAMEIQLTPEQENLLAQLATDKGKAVDTLATEVIRHYLDDETRFIAAVKIGEEELARGEYFTSEQVGSHVAQLFKS